MVRCKGAQQLRQRLVYATLCGATLRVDDIRARDQSPGLKDYEASLLRLLEKISSGCIVEINETGALPLSAPIDTGTSVSSGLAGSRRAYLLRTLSRTTFGLQEHV